MEEDINDDISISIEYNVSDIDIDIEEDINDDTSISIEFNVSDIDESKLMS